MANYRILLTGGGTGGHIYPLVAVAQKLSQDADIRFFGSPGNFGEYLISAGVKIQRIAASKLRRYFSLQNVLDFFRFFWGLAQGWWKIFWFMPDVAFSKGGPGSLSVVLMCRFYRIPLIIHESDAVPGLTSKVSARGARKIELAFAEAKEYFAKFTKAEVNVVGQPVRNEVLVFGDGAQAKKHFGFSPDIAVILIIGGSQGAEAINDFVLNNLTVLLGKFQILHVVGSNNYNQHKAELDFISQKINQDLLKRYHCEAYLSDNLAEAYNAADLVVSRAGAGSIFEIAAKGKPAVIIPLATSANGHQEKNAYAYAETGAAVIMEEANLLENIFINEIVRILSDGSLYSKMSEAARSFYKEDAANRIADDIIKLV
ncbi:MAG: UDP-N-acetylglucosamine--N-acetylmuramyl-(pentapeptide) pyrophosphoryl-undecaprenol N-acetylglucosamine transferase [bacterium]|nr:UDP-N-acetylglucosamine--N-acetylmuramyl-(pentapeptide) pyrophosphoryl-undecaprenol N-acetylglucosamine transferase [bacterium]